MEIAIKELKVLALFASRQDIRYYLNSIRIVGQHAMATDGHRITILRLDVDSGMDVLIPIQDVDAAIKCAEVLEKRLDRMLRSGTIIVTPTSIGAVTYKPIEGKYPDISKVIPNDEEGSGSNCVSIQGKYWADYHKAAALVGHSRRNTQVTAKVISNDKPVLVRFSDDPRWFSVIMQMRVGDDGDVPKVPEWIKRAFVKQEEGAQA